MNEYNEPYNRRLDQLERRERRLLRDPPPNPLALKLEEKIPPKLEETLNAAFTRAFRLVFEKGSGLLGRTLGEEQLRAGYLSRAAALERAPSWRAVREFGKENARSGRLASWAAGLEGTALGVLGIGLPDIPVLIALLLRSLYATALRYGFARDTPEERYFMLLLLCAALAPRGRAARGGEAERLGRALDHGERVRVDVEAGVKRAAEALSSALLAAKFLQGAPIVGAVGGVVNLSASRRAAKVADLFYERRFLEKKRRGV